MAKKSRRAKAKSRRSGKLARGAPAQRAQAPRSTLEHEAAVAAVEASSPSSQTTRYQYVVPEIRRIGIIAGALFLVLIALSFILG